MEEAITERFLPALLGIRVEAVRTMRPLLALPVREEGLIIPDPTASADCSHLDSVSIVGPLTWTLATNDTQFDVMFFVEDAWKACKQCQAKRILTHDLMRQ